MMPDLSGRYALVTGAASGIGLETAKAMALAGADVVIADIDQAAGLQAVQDIARLAATGNAEFIRLDLADQAEIEHACQPLLARGRPLDLLFNNAGIQPLSRRRMSVDGFELTFAIGHLGHFALTCRLLPLLLAAPRPRVITTSSLVHRHGRIATDDLNLEQGYSAQRAYNQTKLANLLFARELQSRARKQGTSLLSLAAHPGVARTAIGAHRSRQGRLGWRDHLVSATLALVMPMLGQDAAQGALPLLHAATHLDVEPGHLYGPQGLGEMKGPPGPARIVPHALDPVLAGWL